MRILYVLARPELSGGVKVVFEHAQLLRRAGLDALVCGEGARPAWAEAAVPYHDLTVEPPPERLDVAIATYWTTIARVASLPARWRVHFCQGYEGLFPHLDGQRSAIEQAYGVDWPTLIVAPHLARLLGGFSRSAFHVTPPPVAPGTGPAAPAPPWRIHVPGIYECTWKGVPTALDAVAQLTRKKPVSLVRVSLLTPPAQEPVLAHRELHIAITPHRARQVLESCHIALFGSEPAEGFGLPLLEAMASGIPIVATDIPSARFITGAGSTPRVPVGDSAAMARAALRLIEDEPWREQVIASGLEEAKRFAPERVTHVLLKALREITGLV